MVERRQRGETSQELKSVDEYQSCKEQEDCVKENKDKEEETAGVQLSEYDDDDDKMEDERDDDDDDYYEVDDESLDDNGPSAVTAAWTGGKLLTASILLWSALYMQNGGRGSPWLLWQSARTTEMAGGHGGASTDFGNTESRRRLMEEEGNSSTASGHIPLYMRPVMKDLEERKKLFDETPPEEIKYWFEYTGPLQKYFYRFSKSRQKADYFEGRDDSGVVSSRFVEETGGTDEYRDLFLNNSSDQPDADIDAVRSRLLQQCLAMGSSARPDVGPGTVWHTWFAQEDDQGVAKDRCRVLFAMNTVGAGRGTTMLWETRPPLLHEEDGPRPWTSEQENAVTHIERNLAEIDAMCETGLIAARVQVLVCEPIPAVWTEWMDSQLVHCGGKPWPVDRKIPKGGMDEADTVEVEERPSPVQVVVAATPSTADSCHDLKSGFMEKRMQDLLLAPPYLDAKKVSKENADPSVKSTHPDLVSSDHHDLYVAFKWSSLVTLRSVHAFLSASADIVAGASSPSASSSQHGDLLQPPRAASDGTVVGTAPSSPFLIPSFVRVSYVSEENSKVAKWRMHGDFFHPAAWEISKDSFDVTWIPHSLAGSGADGLSTICPSSSSPPPTGQTPATPKLGSGPDCGQWWIFMNELQMPTTPEVYANEVSPAPVMGGSNFIWMVTERQRQEIVKGLICQHDREAQDSLDPCPAVPQAVFPLGDLESFLINYTPNTALGRQHVKGRRPGYGREFEREEERKRVRDRKQLHGIEDIEKALFDYTIYPAALFHKDATLKAARLRDVLLENKSKTTKGGSGESSSSAGPWQVKSSYYDVTITKPRPPVLGWCQAISRKGLCSLYADYFRLNANNDERCLEACGLRHNWTPISVAPQ